LQLRIGGAVVITLDHETILRLAAPADLIRPIRAALRHPAVSPDRIHYAVGRGARPPGSLMLSPAWREGDFIGVKIAGVFCGNAQAGLPTVAGQYLLLSAETGQPAASLDGRALSLLAASAVSALAADILAPREASRLLMVGAGALAPLLIEAHACVRDYRRIELWARDAAKARRLAERLAAQSIAVEVAEDLEAAARRADVISCATLSDQPLVRGAWLRPACHLDLVGGFRPDMREADDDALRDALVATDAPRAAGECGDLCEPLAARVIKAGDMLSLEDLCAPGFERGPRRSVFKALGAPAAELAAAEHLLHRAVASRPRREQPALLAQFAH
jgi:ornithine cyclodeaminase